MWEPESKNIYPKFDQNTKFSDLIEMSKQDIVLRDRLWLPNSAPLFPFQRISLRAIHEAQIIWLEGTRGTAKSWLDARGALLEGLENPLKIVCTGPTFRQALHPFNYIDQFVQENKDDNLPLSLSREQEGVTSRGSKEAVLRLRNGTTCKALPMGVGDKIRGERADILICDEFFLMEREMFNDHILPFLLGHHEPGSIKKLIMSTSAEFEDSFAYSVLSKRIIPNVLREDGIKAMNPEYKRVYALLSWNVDDVRAEGYNLDQEVLNLLLDDANQEERDQVLYNKWKGTSGQFFPPNLISKMSAPFVGIEYERDGEHEYGMTIDVARVKNGDSFVVNIFKFLPELGNKMGFVHAYWNKGMTASEMAWKIFQYDEKFHPTWIVMDKGGGGIFVRDELMKSTLEFADGTKKTIKPTDFIIEWNENRSIPGQKKLIFNRYSDEKVRQAFADDRSRGGEYIHNEDIMSHLLYDGLRQTLSIYDSPIIIPSTFSDDESDGENSEAVIFDRIRTSIQQLKLLRLETKTDENGNRVVVKSKVNKVPKYVWKHSEKDGGVCFCYSYILYKLMYREGVSKYDKTDPLIKATVQSEAGFDGVPDTNPGQTWNPFTRQYI